jgi:hypothetical protein
MKVDIAFPGWAPFNNLAIAENINGYLASMDTILEYDFRRMVTGHYSRAATRRDIEVQRAYLRDVELNAGKALQSIDFMQVAKKTGMENVALLFDTYLEAAAQKCSALTVPKWKGVLGGVDVATPSHCFELIMALRVD